MAYINIKEEFIAAPWPHLGSSDHLSVVLIPAYKTLLIREKTIMRYLILGGGLWRHYRTVFSTTLRYV